MIVISEANGSGLTEVIHFTQMTESDKALTTLLQFHELNVSWKGITRTVMPNPFPAAIFNEQYLTKSGRKVIVFFYQGDIRSTAPLGHARALLWSDTGQMTALCKETDLIVTKVD